MTANHNTQMTPHDLLAQIRKDRAAMAKLWGCLTEEQMTHRPGPQADWSVKDLIAHMTWWESFIMEGVTGLHPTQHCGSGIRWAAGKNEKWKLIKKQHPLNTKNF
jgi:hypothetical protein